jgi:hypothetical protein
MTTKHNSVVVHQSGSLTPALGGFEEFSFDDYFYAESMTFEDGEDEVFDYVETYDGIYQVVPESNGNVLNILELSHPEIEPNTGGPINNGMWVLERVTDDYIDRENIITQAGKLKNLNVAVVHGGGYLGLALTGGGMDLSWQVAAAHVRLGYYPPTNLGSHNLGYGISQLGHEEAVTVAEAMVEEMERARRVLEGDIEHLNSQLHQAEVKRSDK